MRASMTMCFCGGLTEEVSSFGAMAARERAVLGSFIGYNYKVETIKRLPVWGVYALLAYMPFHIFISTWLGSSLGGLNAWKVGKDILTIGLFVLTGCLVLLKVCRREWQRYAVLIVLTALYALLHVVLYLVNKDTLLEIAALASTYNNRFIWVLLIGLGAGLLVKNPTNQKQLIKFVLIVSTIVCVLGLLQWFLPSDVLTHFGYHKALGVKPNFFINEDPAYPRVFATLRDPNSLGAYLLVPILLLVQQLGKAKRKRLIGVVLGLHLVVLYLTFSRAAWVGLVVGLGVLFIMSHRQKISKLMKRFWPLIIVGVVLLVALVLSLRHTSQFRSIVLKIDDKNAPTELDSDEYHLHFIKQGVNGIARRPLGHGPGTAGIVSIHNDTKGQLTENYYVQIAYEVGVVGLLIFLAIWWLSVRLLLNQRQEPLAMVLVSAAGAYAVMCLVMHLWTNEAVAYTWWGLAALTITYNVQGSTLYMRREERRAQ